MSSTVKIICDEGDKPHTLAIMSRVELPESTQIVWLQRKPGRKPGVTRDRGYRYRLVCEAHRLSLTLRHENFISVLEVLDLYKKESVESSTLRKIPDTPDILELLGITAIS